MNGGGGTFSCTCNRQQRGTSIYVFFAYKYTCSSQMLLTYFPCMFCAWWDLESTKTMRVCEPKIIKWR